MLQRAREFLARKGVAEGRLEAELLVAHALGVDRLRLFMGLDRPVQPTEVERARELLVRRAAHEPVAYLTGTREFYGRPFAVDARVLIPRPETELLIDRARALWERAGLERPARVLDYGTGSGCLAVTAALELPGARVLAVDVSAQALEAAGENARRLEAEVACARVEGPEQLTPEKLAAALGGPPDLILSNPPYVTQAEAAALAPEVREHEPALALLAPEGDPDHWLRRLARFAAAALADGGALLCELGASQGERAVQVAAQAGLRAEVHPDLAGLPRVLEGRRQRSTAR